MSITVKTDSSNHSRLQQLEIMSRLAEVHEKVQNSKRGHQLRQFDALNQMVKETTEAGQFADMVANIFDENPKISAARTKMQERILKIQLKALDSTSDFTPKDS